MCRTENPDNLVRSQEVPLNLKPMKIYIRKIGGSSLTPAKIIELLIKTNSIEITEDVTNLHGLVDENFIQDLRNIADELEEQNKKLKP